MTIRHKAAVAGFAVALSLGACPVGALATPTQADLDTASARLEELGGELAQLQATLADQETELQRTETDIETKQGEVDATTVELGQARATLAGRMRSTYKTGPSSLLSILLDSDSVEEIVSNIYIADKIAAQDAETISSVRNLEEQLVAQVAELEEQKTAQEAAIEATRAQTDEYTQKVAEAREYYESLDAEIQAELVAQAEREAAAAAAAAAAGQAQAAPSAQTTVVMAVDNGQSTSADVTESSDTEDSDESDSGSTSGGSGGNIPQGGGVSAAFAAIGSPYVWGATGPDSFDCSGLVCYVYGYARGRTTYDMIASLQSTGDWHTDESELNYGDLVFTHEGHVGIYTGNHTMIDAPQPGQTVTQRTIWTTIYGGGPY